MSNLLLLSGGIDSICLAAQFRPDICLTVDYGQRAAKAELKISTQVCQTLSLRHITVKADIAALGSGQMVGHDSSHLSENAEFWPFRNQFLVTLAGMVALNEGCTQIMIGTVKTDQRHSDGSSMFLELLHQLLQLQEGGLTLVAPALEMTSEQLIEVSGTPLELLSWAHSCHTGDLACGQCFGCNKHSRIMQSIGLNR